MKLTALFFLYFTSIITYCNGQAVKQNGNAVKLNVDVAKGDIVKELGKNIMVIYQDKKKIYWFGSWQTGLYRYDGKTIINYTTKQGLPHNRVDEIKEDSQGNIYINGCYPFSAITKFDGQKFAQLNVSNGKQWKLQPDDLWFKHPNETGQVYRFDGSRLYRLNVPKPSGLSNPFEIYSIYKDTKGYVWFGSNPVGVCRYNGKSFEWITESDVTELQKGPANGVRSIVEDSNGYFWFNTQYRYNIYHKPINSKAFYERQKSIGSLDGKNNGDLCEYLSSTKDNNGNLWFVTYDAGVWMYNGIKVKHFPVQLNFKDIHLFSIYKDNKNGLWIATHENGVFKFNGEAFEQFKL